MRLLFVLQRNIKDLLDSFEEINLMVLKYTPLGEINLPSVASNAIIPRCRRQTKFAARRGQRQPTLSLTSAPTGVDLKVAFPFGQRTSFPRRRSLIRIFTFGLDTFARCE